jgi:hypothetical protein
MRALAAALALLAGTAAAQATPGTSPLLPGVTPEQRVDFSVCRAAVFYHLDPAAEARTVPKAAAEALRQQIAFIMHETLRRAPAGSLAEARAAIDFAETFFLSFSATIAEQRRLRDDTAARESRLLACVPLVWRIATGEIDALMALRERLQPR